MRLARFAVVITFSACANACTTISAPPTPESARILVQLSVARTAAYDKTVAAFVAEGLNIANGSTEGTLASVPIDIANQVPATYRAAFIGTDSGTTVVLSGSIKNENGAVMAQAMTGLKSEAREFQLHSAMTGQLGEAWARLERIAARLRETAR